MALYEALRPAMKLWYSFHYARGAAVPRPRGSTSVRIGPAGGRRVLLIGNGPCHGWGVLDHGVALAGHLAAELARRARIGTEVDYLGDETMNIASAPNWLGSADRSDVDAVVVVIGVNDAVRLTPETSWTRDYARLLDRLRERVGEDVPILVVGSQSPSTVPVYGGPLGRLADAHAERLNDALRELAANRAGVEYTVLGPPPRLPERPFGSPAMYRAWAESIAVDLLLALTGRLAAVSVAAGAPTRDAARAAAIDAARHELAADLAEQDAALAAAHAEFAGMPDAFDAVEVVPVVIDGKAWAGMDEAIRLAAAGRLDALTSISSEARARFGVNIATVTLVEGDRARYLGGEGGNMPTSVPLDLTHCSHVVNSDDVLVVPNSPKDPRFADNPMLDLTHVQFYAGHPLHSSTGETIGTFCLMGGFPKKAEQIDLDALEAFAKRAEQELWKLEPGQAPAGV